LVLAKLKQGALSIQEWPDDSIMGVDAIFQPLPQPLYGAL